VRMKVGASTIGSFKLYSFQFRLLTAMKLIKTPGCPVLEDSGHLYLVSENDWDALINREDLESVLTEVMGRASVLKEFDQQRETLAPIGRQEVWAAGVTYLRSRTARIEESKLSGSGDFYDRVYVATRPELFFKATPSRVAGPGQKVRIRRDSNWNVPEPELALAINSSGKIIGYTIGNDMSSRDIEGENPLYLPQAKIYAQCCGLGPAIYISSKPLESSTEIHLEILRDGKMGFRGSTNLTNLKRALTELVEYLFRDNVFPYGCFLLTGTGIVPPDDFTLQAEDEIRITVEPIGTLMNTVTRSEV
jgi:2-dehydro-3-deoxy-D-arabinonate dehydratase